MRLANRAVGESGPPVETLVRTYVGEQAVIGEVVPCTAAVGDLIVVYAAAAVGECFLQPDFRPTWNGLSFTVVQQPYNEELGDDFTGGEEAQTVAIATLLVPTGKAGTYNIAWDFHDQQMDGQSIYAEKWAGVTSGTVNRQATARGYDRSPGTAGYTPTVNHALVLCAVGRDGAPAAEGTWVTGLTGAGHMHTDFHLSTAYEIQTTATARAANKSGVTLGYWGAITVMMSAA